MMMKNDWIHVHDGLTIQEPYKSYWTDFICECYDILELNKSGGHVDLIFVGEIQGGLLGSTVHLDGVVDIEIAISSMGNPVGFDDMCLTIAHEMVHAEQYLSGRLEQHNLTTNDNGEWTYKYVWCGKDFVMPGKSRPWEDEAYQKEAQLVSNVKYNLRNY
jgi:hypothetical protein